MIANLSLGFVLIAGLFAVPAYAFYSNEHLELVDVEEVVDEEGLVTFTGHIRNTHEYQPINPLKVFLTLKREGIVSRIYQGRYDDFEPILPGHMRSFSVPSDAIQGDYDDFSIRAVGYLGTPDPASSSLTGSLLLVEDGLNFTVIGPDSTSVILGELLNDTNAVLTNLTVQFRLFKNEDCLIGLAKPSEKIFDDGSLAFQDLLPGESISFIAYSDVSFEQVTRWEYDVGFELVRIVPETMPMQIEEDATGSTPTTVIGATWGQIKHGIGEEK